MNNNYLMSIQAEYLMNRSSVAFYQELFQAVYDMAIIHIKSILRIHGYQVDDTLKTAAEDVCIQLMNRYTNPEWYVKTNFGKAIYLECKKQLFDKRYKDKLKYGQFWEIHQQDIANEYVTAEKTEGCLQMFNKKTIFAKQIRNRARKSKSYQSYLDYIAHRHSLGWIDENLESIQYIWEISR